MPFCSSTRLCNIWLLSMLDRRLLDGLSDAVFVMLLVAIQKVLRVTFYRNVSASHSKAPGGPQSHHRYLAILTAEAATVVFRLGKSEYRSSRARRSRSPKWNETFVLDAELEDLSVTY